MGRSCWICVMGLGTCGIPPFIGSEDGKEESQAAVPPGLTSATLTTCPACQGGPCPRALGEREAVPYSCFPPGLVVAPGLPKRDFSKLASHPLGLQGKGPGARGQGWEEPPGWASLRRVQLGTAAAAAPAGPWQGEEGAFLHQLLPGMGHPDAHVVAVEGVPYLSSQFCSVGMVLPNCSNFGCLCLYFAWLSPYSISPAEGQKMQALEELLKTSSAYGWLGTPAY